MVITMKLLYNGTSRYTYDFDRETTKCTCGFEISDQAVRSRPKEIIDKLTAHAIAHRLIDD